MSITLRGDLHTLYRDRKPDTTIWRGAAIEYTTDSAHTIPIQVATRGMFRLRTCDIPPIRLRIEGDRSRGTPFARMRRPKLVSACRNTDEYEQFVLQEYAIYHLWRLFTPWAFETRLLRVTYQDSSNSLRPVTRYGYLVEDPQRFTERMRATESTRPNVAQAQLDPASAAMLGVFMYFVANTDWSVPGRHNIFLAQKDSVIYPVAFDFDWSGVIDAPYAHPDLRLRLRSVRERKYRGICFEADELNPVLDRFVALKDSIIAAYRSVPGMAPRTVEQATRYFDEFYREIADRPRFMRMIARDCMH